MCEAAIDELRHHYDEGGHGIELVEVAGGWQLLSRPEYTTAIERAQMATRPHRLSSAALETLALIAYRQPITRADIEEIRGVSAGSILKSLLERGLVDVIGKADALGRPLLYGTTPTFLELFLRSGISRSCREPTSWPWRCVRLRSRDGWVGADPTGPRARWHRVAAQSRRPRGRRPGPRKRGSRGSRADGRSCPRPHLGGRSGDHTSRPRGVVGTSQASRRPYHSAR